MQLHWNASERKRSIATSGNTFRTVAYIINTCMARLRVLIWRKKHQIICFMFMFFIWRTQNQERARHPFACALESSMLHKCICFYAFLMTHTQLVWSAECWRVWTLLVCTWYKIHITLSICRKEVSSAHVCTLCVKYAPVTPYYAPIFHILRSWRPKRHDGWSCYLRKYLILCI